MEARRHEVFARTLRRPLGEAGRLDFQEALGVEMLAEEGDHPVAKLEVLKHARAAQVEVAMFEAQFLVDGRRILHVERRRLGSIQDLDRLGQQLDLAGRKVGIDLLRASGLHHAADTQAVFVAQFRQPGRGIRIELGRHRHDLEEAAAVAHIQEDDLPHIAAGIHPSADLDLLARQLGGRAVHGPWHRRVP
jgi:hypothetical protein